MLDFPVYSLQLGGITLYAFGLALTGAALIAWALLGATQRQYGLKPGTTAALMALAVSAIIGGGFSRYSTDAMFLIPHFEKMLYDNALLIMAYAETYQATGNPLYKKIAEKTITYVNRDLRSAEGAF